MSNRKKPERRYKDRRGYQWGGSERRAVDVLPDPYYGLDFRTEQRRKKK